MGALFLKDGVGGPRGEFLFFSFLDALLVMRAVLWPLRLILSFPFCGFSHWYEDDGVALEVISVFPYMRVMLPWAQKVHH